MSGTEAAGAQDVDVEKPERLIVPALVHGACLVVHGPPGAPLVVGCHGYGESADDHLAELRRLPGASALSLAAVEAPHPFYTKNGDVVRSWMTRVDREEAIEDNIRYVSSVVARLRRRLRPGALFFSGFSQGVAMAWRAAVCSGFPCAGLVALAGDVPPDVAELGPAVMPPVLLGRGTKDKWYDQKKMDADLGVLGKLGAEVETCVFKAGHEWSDEFRAAAADFIARRAAGANREDG